MRIVISIIFFIHTAKCSISQSNLVLNPSFENSYDPCFPSIAGIDYGQVDSWSSPNHSSSDYFLPFSWDGFGCTAEGLTSPPMNTFGFQYAHHGECYGGFGLLATSSYYEYIQGSLRNPLMAGKSYAIECFVAKTELSACMSDFGFVFTDTLVSVHSFDRLPYVPQFENDTNNKILMYSNWQRITGKFIASGGERFFSIGNFQAFGTEHSQLCNGPFNTGVYLYIDDVAVYDTSKIDTIHLCLNDSVELGGIWRKSVGLYFDTISSLPIRFYIEPRPESASLTIVDVPFTLGDSVKAGNIWVTKDTIVEVPKHNIYGCDSLVRYLCRTNVGISNPLSNKNKQWSIFPNPANEFLQVAFNNNDPNSYTITILDITGKDIISQSISNAHIDVSSLTSGMYFVKVLNSKTGKLIGTEKFVKE